MKKVIIKSHDKEIEKIDVSKATNDFEYLAKKDIHYAILVRENYKEGAISLRCMKNLSKGNRYIHMENEYRDFDLTELIKKLIEHGWEIYRFDTTRKLLEFYMQSSRGEGE